VTGLLETIHQTNFAVMHPFFDCSRFLKTYFLIATVFSALLTGGCSSSPKKPVIDQAKVKQFSARGYDSGTEYATSNSRLWLSIGNECCQIALAQPKREGKYPLVIYLPGLGESSDAGSDMRIAWAKSGYVVLSFQALKDDESIWSSEAAHNADFAFIRQDRHSPEIVSKRLDILAKVIVYLKQHVASGDADLQRIDMTRIAVIGFDIGARSAMIVAGENVQNVSITGLPVSAGGVIALSPYADYSGPGFDTRYQNIDIPVLSITSDSDGDMQESVPSALHQAPFQYMPPSNKYLLLLDGASHSVIGDQRTASADATEKDGGEQHENHSNNGGGSNSGRTSRHGKRSSNGESGSGFPSGNKAGISPTQRAMTEVAIEQVTTAFLNAYIKNDQLSSEWLRKDAQSWLDKSGELKQK
jgi:dienelactone hydrolase